MDLVGVNPARDVEQVSDVLRAGASRTRSGESPRSANPRKGLSQVLSGSAGTGEPSSGHCWADGPRLEVGRSS